MRRTRTLVAIAAVALGLAAVAHAELPSGIARPDSEAGLSQQELGSQLYAANCSTCHGIAGEGVATPNRARGAGNVRGLGPPLVGVGAQAVDFYLTTGFMPLQNPKQQPWRRKVEFTPKEIAAITTYVSSLGPGPPIPHPRPEDGNVSEGFHLFTQNCAGCHQAVAEGGYVPNARVPVIKADTPRQIAEAVRIGPNLMPVFSRRRISNRQLNSIIAYIQAVKHPNDRGGWGIGHIGPVPEGMFTWLVAAVAVIAMCVLIGERARRA